MHLSNIILAGLCTIALSFSVCTSIGSGTLSEGSFPCSSTQNIIVTFTSDIDVNSKEKLLCTVPDTDILWQTGTSALLRVSAASSDHVLSSLRASKFVAAADFDAPIEVMSVSQDAYTNTQWPLDNPGSYSYISSTRTMTLLGTEDVDMNIPEAWKYFSKLSPSPRDVIVAVVDTGVDINHPDLTQNIWINESEIAGDGIDNDNNGWIDDINGWDFVHDDNTVCHYAKDGVSASPEDDDNHGTHVAGIIAAARDNAIGIAGVASCANIKIMPLKIHGGPNGNGLISDAVRAIEYATAMGADICNISWGTTRSNSALEYAVRSSDMLFVCAAGNTGEDNDATPVYPGSYTSSNVLCVTHINASGKLHSTSNYGAKSVDLAAPGVYIYSTNVGSYKSMTGSSMAAPHVSGVAALLYAFGEHQYPANIKKIILNTCKPLDDLNGKTATPGIPDAYSALKHLSSVRYDYYAPTLQFTPSFDRDALCLTVTAKDTGKSGVRTIRYASKIRDLSYFRRGTSGEACSSGDTLKFTAPGKYTFYVSDYAGNERIMIYQLEDDKTAPDALLTYQVSYDLSTITIKVKASDTESGVKTVKYAPGVHDVSYFLSGSEGTEVALKSSSGSFKTEAPGTYTVYLADYRGNKSVHTIQTKIIPATGLAVQATAKTLAVGKTWNLIPSVYPKGSTDAFRYISSNPAVCRVSGTGKITAVAPGSATITVRTASGLSAQCRIKVE